VDRLSKDLKAEFPEMKGLSSRNLKYMRAFAETWEDEVIVQQLAAQLPWGHNMILLDTIDGQEVRVFYAIQAAENGWTRKVLQAQIASQLHTREGKALTNFSDRLPATEAQQVQLITRDPYAFDFITLAKDVKERDLEKALLADMRTFMLELGAGFAFVASQYHLEVSGEDFYIDLLFFHIPTNRYVVIDRRFSMPLNLLMGL
jgi:predicted nuclease of restriction endonuclease-like (RecB) superfamily